MELLRTRDVIVQYKGGVYPVAVSEAMATGGWRGGQAVMWAPSSQDDFLVTYSNGYYAGFLLWGSDESSDQYTSITGNQPFYRFAIVCAGGWQMQTATYEQFTYASRIGGGPLVPLVYHASDRLVFSNRGLFTKEDEWTLSGDARAPNNYYVAFVSQAPSALTNNYMGIQVSI